MILQLVGDPTVSQIYPKGLVIFLCHDAELVVFMLCTNQHPRSNLGLLEVSNAEKRKSFPENIFPESNTEARLLALNKMQNIMTLDEIPDLGGRVLGMES